MAFAAIEKKLEEITRRIVEKLQPQKIILFGSYAWGKPDEHSDIDLFIVAESDKERRERQRELRAFLFPPILPFDLLVYTPEETKKRLKQEDFFISDIVNNGKVLYDATK